MEINGLIAENQPTAGSIVAEHDRVMRQLYAYKRQGEDFETFKANKESEFDGLLNDGTIVPGDLINGEVNPGYSNIMQLVPPVPDGCALEVLNAQADLIAIAEVIESNELMLLWLRPQLDACCVDAEFGYDLISQSL